jgi:uncharacterized protein YbjQ (UPF0145 family)
MAFFDRNRTSDGDGDGAPGDFGTGSVPLGAQRRLSRTRTSGQFTSTLSAKEFAVLSTLGPHPLAQVLGASVFQIGWQTLPSAAQWAGDDFSFPLTLVNAAWSDARRLALGRLRDEARMVGADAVVGVHLRRGEQDWGRRTVEFAVSGTAIRLPGSHPPADQPALSDLSVQDYWKLLNSGWDPTEMVATTSAMFVSQGRGTRWRRRTSMLVNQEIHEYSEGFSNARRIAVLDLRDQAREAGADGVVGVSFRYEMTDQELVVDQRNRPDTGVHIAPMAVGVSAPPGGGGADKRDGIVFTVQAAGTAIRRGQALEGAPAPTIIQMDLNDR